MHIRLFTGAWIAAVLAAFCLASLPLMSDASVAGTPPKLASLDPQDVGVGSCFPNPIVVTHLMDCRFPLSSAAIDVVAAQAVVEDLESASFELGRSWPCRVQDGQLICERIAAPRVGDMAVAVEIDESQVLARASVTVLPYSLPADVSSNGADPGAGQIQVVIADQPIDLESTRRVAEGAVWVLLRTWPNRSEVQSVKILDETQSKATVELTIPDSGEYELVLCLGERPDACAEDVSGRRLQVIDPNVVELVPSHNLPGVDRVNLVVTGGGWESIDKLTEVAGVLFDPAAIPILSTEGDELWWPPFSIEPLASNGLRFNLWLLPDQIGLPGIVQGDGINSPVAEAFGLDDSTFFHLQADPVRLGGYANMSSFWESVTPPGPSDHVVLGSAVQFVDPAIPFASAQGIAHELGHTLFGLIDEYQRDAETPKLGPPNCAADHAEADGLWGEMVGELDPQLATYRKSLQDHGLWTDQLEATLEGDLTVGFFDGWCLAPTKGAVIPTRRSLMNDNNTMYGSVNRRYAELVLQRWSSPEPTPETSTTPGFVPTTNIAATATETTTRPANSVPEETDNGLPAAIWVVALAAAAATSTAGIRRWRTRIRDKAEEK